MVIKGATLCDIDSEYISDIEFIDGVITKIEPSIDSDEYIDGSGCYFIPALVDTNLSLKDRGLNQVRLEKLSRRALRGGVGTVVLSSDLIPKIDNEIILEFVQQHKELEFGATIESCVSAINSSGELSNISIMLKKGSSAVYTTTISDYNLVSRIAQYLQRCDRYLFYKAEEKSLKDSGVMADGAVASNLGLAGIPAISELVHVAAMIEVARFFDINVVFKSITEPRSIELIKNAQNDGVRVKSEVAIHHLFKNDSECMGFDTDAKIDPPLVSEEKRLKLLEHLKAGDIDMLTALHQPNSDVNKDITFYDASMGTTAILEYLPLLYTYLVDKKTISMSDIIKLSSHNPALTINQITPKISVGSCGKFILFDTNDTTPVRHHHSLYKKELLKGRVIMAITKDGAISY